MSEIEFVHGDPSFGPCSACGRTRELRMGCCFDCAIKGEERAAKRTVEEHLREAIRLLAKGNDNAQFALKWALERLTETGDYAPGGTFDREGYEWRAPAIQCSAEPNAVPCSEAERRDDSPPRQSKGEG